MQTESDEPGPSPRNVSRNLGGQEERAGDAHQTIRIDLRAARLPGGDRVVADRNRRVRWSSVLRPPRQGS